MAQAKEGARPLGLRGCYAADSVQLQSYVTLAASEDGFARYLQQHIFGREAAE